MKKSLLLLAAATLALAAHGNAQFTDLVSLGSATYTIDAGSSSGSYSQSLSGVTYSPSVALGDSVGGVFSASPLNWSSFSDLGSTIYLKLVVTGTNPNLPMSLEIFNSALTASVKYQGTTDPLASGTAAPYFKFTLNGLFDPSVMAGVGGAQITWDGDGTINANLEGIATVPEPSTFVLLALAGSGLVFRRLRRACK